MKHTQHLCDLQLIRTEDELRQEHLRFLMNVSQVFLHDPRPGRQQGSQQLICQVHKGNQDSEEEERSLNVCEWEAGHQ